MDSGYSVQCFSVYRISRYVSNLVRKTDKIAKKTLFQALEILSS